MTDKIGVLLLILITGLAYGSGSRQLATGGGTAFEGAAGGGFVPWAVLSGYATNDEFGVSSFYTRAEIDDYRLDAYGAAINFKNRVELSFARQELDLQTLGPALGFPGASLQQDVVGVKVRLYGDILYTALPQISIGAQYKRNRAFEIPGLVGAEADDGVDVYVSAAKLFFGALGGLNLFVNGTVRYTEANETGFLGFGGPVGSNGSINFEAAAGVLLTRKLILGAEYRMKPSSKLSGLPESDWYNIFLGYFPNRHFSIVAAYVNLGEVATLPSQDGWYLSIEGSF